MIKSVDTDNKSQCLLQNAVPNSSNNVQLLPQIGLAMPLLEENEPPVRRQGVIYVKKSLSKTAKKRLKWIGIILVIIIVLCVLFAFIGLPLIFMNSIAFQRLVMFTNLGLPSEDSYFRKYELKPGLRNLYISVLDLNNKSVVSLGTWHLLPFRFEEEVITDQNFDFKDALKNSNTSVLLYFHGAGEDRSAWLLKYALFRFFFHIITFDYRSYADSSKNDLSEDAIVNDCVQLYEWVTTQTLAPIFVWGHSLGTALATRTVATLKSKPNVTQPVGLILEAAFTRMSEELYVHPYGKIFAWLPWFKSTIISPLEENGFVFNTEKYILNVDCPIMILCSEDDSVVPYRFGLKLSEIAKNRTITNTTLYYQFAGNLNYDHYFLYQDPFVPYFINYFRYICLDEKQRGVKEEL